MRCAWLGLCLALAPAAAFGARGFTLDSPTLSEGARMPIANVYTRCGGGNVSPALEWHHPPADTKSFAVTMYDPDAPGGFWHWIIYEIPVGAHGLNANAGAPRSGNAPGDAAQLPNDFGDHGYSGPCPPSGTPHHYVITVYALDVPELGLAAHVSRKIALAGIEKHTLAKATLTVVWDR
jgi:Raf kinase inhibitor-like YbhB/YbcL family protein